MSKPIIVNKTALLLLDPDKFSIHTFELSMQLPPKKWKAIIDQLYKSNLKHLASKIYEDEKVKDLFHLNAYQGNGIRITLRCIKHSSGYRDYCVNMIVNPIKLIDTKSSYIGILPPKRSSIDQLKSRFSDLFEGTAFESDIDAYELKRVDLCVNVRCDNKKIFREIVRTIRKLPTPPKYERKLSNGKDKSKINKHYL